MSYAAVSVPARSFQPQPLVPAQAARRGRPGLQELLADHERHRLARELHDGAIQEVLAAGLAIDWCLSLIHISEPTRPY